MLMFTEGNRHGLFTGHDEFEFLTTVTFLTANICLFIESTNTANSACHLSGVG